jgi:hypothetical protein
VAWRQTRPPLIRSSARVSVWLVGLAFAGALSPAADPIGHTVPVPGGLPALLERAGLPASLEPDAALVALLRRLHPGHGDRPSPLADCLEHLATAAGRAAAGEASDSLWLPLPAELWDTVLLGRRVAPEARLAALLGNRAAARLALGLLGLDPPTLQALAADPLALRALQRDGAETFALFGPAVRVREGAVDVPGGDEGRALFAEQGCLPAAPASFLVCLMQERDGRLAWLYDTLARLDTARLRFALGLGEPDARLRAERRAALAGAFFDADPFWLPSRPAARVLPDAAWVLRQAPVDAEGRLHGGFSSREWEALLDGKAGPAPTSAAPNAAWLLRSVVRRTTVAGRTRLERLRFCARVVEASPGLSFTTLARIARGYAEAPALFLVLERMGLLEPTLLGQASDVVERLSALGDGEQALAAIAQLQGALALVDAASGARVLTADAAAALCRSLFELPIGDDGYAGRLAVWLDDVLLARLRESVADAADLDREAVVAWALSGSRPAGTLFWEGLRYRVDVTSAWRARFEEARRRQQGVRLEQALGLVHAARAWRDQPASPGARIAVGRALAEASGPQSGEGLSRVRAALRRADAPSVLASADLTLAHVLRDLAYAVTAATLGDVSLARLSSRHELGPPRLGAERRIERASRLPGLLLGRGWVVQGSILGLEVALARAVIRRLDDEPPLEPPVLEPREIETLALGVALMRPLALNEELRDDLAQALHRGWLRAASLTAGDVDATAARLGLEAWRREAWRRALDAEAGVPFLTLSELAVLGEAPAPGCDAYGASRVLLGGGLCLAPVRLESGASVAGFEDDGVKAAGVADLALRILMIVAEEALPAALVQAVAARTVSDLIDTARPADAADGLALARAAAGLRRDRIDDAVASLAATGALVPLPDAAGDAR